MRQIYLTRAIVVSRSSIFYRMQIRTGKVRDLILWVIHRAIRGQITLEVVCRPLASILLEVFCKTIILSMQSLIQVGCSMQVNSSTIFIYRNSLRFLGPIWRAFNSIQIMFINILVEVPHQISLVLLQTQWRKRSWRSFQGLTVKIIFITAQYHRIPPTIRYYRSITQTWVGNQQVHLWQLLQVKLQQTSKIWSNVESMSLTPHKMQWRAFLLIRIKLLLQVVPQPQAILRDYILRLMELQFRVRGIQTWGRTLMGFQIPLTESTRMVGFTALTLKSSHQTWHQRSPLVAHTLVS